MPPSLGRWITGVRHGGPEDREVGGWIQGTCSCYVVYSRIRSFAQSLSWETREACLVAEARHFGGLPPWTADVQGSLDSSLLLVTQARNSSLVTSGRLHNSFASPCPAPVQEGVVGKIKGAVLDHLRPDEHTRGRAYRDAERTAREVLELQIKARGGRGAPTAVLCYEFHGR